MKDYYLEIIQVVPDDPRAAYRLADEAQVEIREEMSLLSQQLGHLDDLMKYLMPKVVADFVDQPDDWDYIEPVNRASYIQDAALDLINQGQTRVTVQEVRDFLDDKRLHLGVSQPNAVIGTVLARSAHFRKVDVNVFDYVPDDLPF